MAISLKEYEGEFIPSRGKTMFSRDLDGSYLREFLTSEGYVVISNEDTGANGLVITECGYRVSTNGFVSKTEKGE